MLKTTIQLPEIKLIGITAHTCNADEMDPTKAKISATAGKYFSQGLAHNIPGRKKPGVTYCAYTKYASDHNGAYTYFIGEEVESSTAIPDGLIALTIPPQTYSKFTTIPGSMPAVCINAWQKIWGMTSLDFGGNRTYISDFEVYDERAIDPSNTVLDVYIGIKP